MKHLSKGITKITNKFHHRNVIEGLRPNDTSSRNPTNDKPGAPGSEQFTPDEFTSEQQTILDCQTEAASSLASQHTQPQITTPGLFSPDSLQFGVDNLESAYQDATLAWSQLHSGPSKSTSNDMRMAADNDISLDNVTDVGKALSAVLDKVAVFNRVINGIGEIHPYVKMVTTILTGVTKPLENQIRRDENMEDLLAAIGNAFDFLRANVEHPTHLNPHQRSLAHLLTLQTVECAYFVRHYMEQTQFFTRAAKGIISNIDEKINIYKIKINDLKNVFKDQSTTQTNITVMRVYDVVQEIRNDLKLNSLKPVDGASVHQSKMCLENTRVDIVDEISAWINCPGDVPQVFWLCGQAGTGKSAISHTVGQRFKALSRLGAFFSFDRTYSAERTPEKALRTLAHNLAHADQAFGNALVDVLDGDSTIAGSSDIQTQWDDLIIKPAQALTNCNGPIVMIIDAFDECADKSSLRRRALLSVLTKKVHGLPKNFRVLITSRSESDVLHELLRDHSLLLIRKDMSDILNTEEDILQYVKNKMLDSDGGSGVLTNAQCEELARMSEGFFQWAYTACEALQGWGQGGLTVMQRFEGLKAVRPQTQDELKPLDGIYMQVLTTAFNSASPKAMENYKIVMAEVLAATRPLSRKMITRFRCEYLENVDDGTVGVVIPFVGSLFIGVDKLDQGIRPVHTSVRDFLLNRERSLGYHVDLEKGHEILAIGALRLMIKDLKFNICGLPSSYLFNTQVQDTNSRLAENVSAELLYACRSWAHHISYVDIRNALSLLEEFADESSLYWLEVLAIANQIYLASECISIVIQQLQSLESYKVSEYSMNLHVKFNDMLQVVRIFGKMMAESTPHLYLSGLPFLPKGCRLWKNLTVSFRNLPSVCAGLEKGWPSQQSKLQGHTGFVSSVAFSPDGKKIVSGSFDRTVRIWDADTGIAIGEPLQGHTSWVNSARFSLDGQSIVSCSIDGTVRIWDAQTGTAIEEHCNINSATPIAFSTDGKKTVSRSLDNAMWIWDANTGTAIGKPLQGHTDWVTSAAFSPDGRRIVSGSTDKTVQIWDAETGTGVMEPLKQHTDWVTSVAFSPDGRRIVSGSNDNTVRIWDVETGIAVGEPLQGHTKTVSSVVFSPDGSKIASGSVDSTVWIWDVETSTSIGKLLQGHTGIIHSVAFSPDGKRIVSGSDDTTVQIWDIKISTSVEKPSQGHNNRVISVAFSPDGKRIVSGSADNTVQIWDAETGTAIREPFKGHTDWVTSVAFSPDGRRIISGSKDSTLCIWDAETGTAVEESLKGHTHEVTSAVFSPDGRIVSASFDGRMLIWISETDHTAVGKLLQEEQTSPINSVAFSPDGKKIVSGSADSTVQIWDAETGIAVGRPLKGHTNWVTSVAFSPDGRRIVSGSHDSTMQIWDVERGTTVGKPLHGHHHGISSVAFSPDGENIVSGSYDHTVRIWDAVTGAAVGEPFHGHTQAVLSVAFSPDGKRIVSGSCDNTMRIWNAAPVEELLVKHTQYDTPVEFLLDEQMSISQSCILSEKIGQTNSSQPSHTSSFPGENGYEPQSISLDFCGLHLHLNHALSLAYKSLTPIRMTSDGWLIGHNSSLILWIPPEYRSRLRWPHTHLVISTTSSISLDLSHLIHGPDWTQCVMTSEGSSLVSYR